MLSFKDFSPRPIHSSMIKEELTPSQKRKVDDWAGGSHSIEAAIASQGVIPNGQDRVTTPLIHPEAPAIPHPDVQDHLERNGYNISDYRAGKAMDQYGRETNIGKALAKTKADPSVINAFVNDPNRATAKQNVDDKLHVVISRNAYDVAGMSTDRGWTSCMDMNKGSNAHYLKPAVEEGMHVAYLARKDDPELQNPLARIAMVPYNAYNRDGTKAAKTILRPEKTQYGTSDSAFADTVKKWTEKNFPIQDGVIYNRNQEVYNDTPVSPQTDKWREAMDYDSSRLGSFDTLYNSKRPGDRAQAFIEHPEKVTSQHIQSAIDDYKNKYPSEDDEEKAHNKYVPQLIEAMRHPAVTKEQLDDVLTNDPDEHGKSAVAASPMLGAHPDLIKKILALPGNTGTKVDLFQNQNIKLTPEQIDQGITSGDHTLMFNAIMHPSFHESNFQTALKELPKRSSIDAERLLDDVAQKMGYGGMREAMQAHKSGAARPSKPAPARRMEPQQTDRGPYLDPNELPWKESYELFEGFLSDYQKRVVSRWRKSPAALNLSSHVIPPGQDSIRIPLTPPEKPVEPHPEVKQHLEDNGFTISDYRKGTAVDKYGRETTIGRALGKGKAPPSLVAKFVNDPNRTQGRTALSDYVMHISRKPTDIARASTNQGWSSCMRMPEFKDDPAAGCNYHYLKNDITGGTHVAYLAHKDDLQAENPVARILLKPFSTIDHAYNPYSDWQKNNPSHTVLRPEDSVYGTADNAFGDAVKKWSETNFPTMPGRMYALHHNLYNDSNSGPMGDAAAVTNLLKSKQPSQRLVNGTESLGDIRNRIIRKSDLTPENINDVIKGNGSYSYNEHNHLINRGDISLSPQNYNDIIKQANDNAYKGGAGVLDSVAKSRYTPADVIDRMTKHKGISVRMAAAGSGNLQPEHISALMNDKNSQVRMALAENRALRSEHMSQLINDPHDGVRSSAIRHPFTPTSDLQNALKDKDLWNRSEAQKQLYERKNFALTHARKLIGMGATGEEMDKVMGPGSAEKYGVTLNAPPSTINLTPDDEKYERRFNPPYSEGKILKFTDYMLTEERKDPDSTTLHAFDMDETLMAHDHNKLRVHVMDPNGRKVRTLSNQEFNTHKLPPGHSYDFSEFRSSDVFGQSASPIRKMIAKLKAIHKNNKNVEILTARGDMDDKDKFAHHMKKYGIDINQIHVRRAGNMPGKPADTKAAVMSNLINQNGYKKVHLYDDSVDNLNAFLKLKRQHPEVEFNAHHVRHDPETGDVVVTSRKV